MKPIRPASKPCAPAALALAWLALAAPSAAGPVRPLWEPGEWLAADRPLTFELVEPVEGRLAVFLGATDLTDLFRRRGARWIYRPELLPLPPGESELVLFRVAAGEWSEVARFPVRVLTRGGLEARELALRLDIEGLVDLDSGGSDPAPEEERVTAQLDLKQSAARRDWTLRAAANVLAVSQVEQALRFAQEGAEAERADLSSWSLAVGRGRFELGLGHLVWGESRQLVQSFASRGAHLRLPLGAAADLALVAMNGSSMVGWENPLGLARSEHQVQAATLGLELAPAQPGALRLELTRLDGSLLPEPGFNQGVVDDRERSEGWSARLLAAIGGRLRVDAAWAESAFDNPEDPLLGQDAELVSVARERRAARYLDLSWTPVRRASEGGRAFELAFDLQHRRAEPLYRSVAAVVQADVEENAATARVAWGGVSALFGLSEGRDNLDDLPSILTTRTDRLTWSFTLPFAELSQRPAPSPWLPLLSFAGERTGQRGDGVPENGDFAPSHVPDQVSASHQATLAWNGAGWSLAANAALSDQDNRQPGRERADFRHAGGGISLFLFPHPSLDLGLDLREERQENEEAGERTTTRVVGLNWTLRLPARHLWSGSLSRTESETSPEVRASDDLVGEMQWAWSFERRRRAHGFSGRLFLRAAYREADSSDFLFGFVERRDAWTATAGFAWSAF